MSTQHINITIDTIESSYQEINNIYTNLKSDIDNFEEDIINLSRGKIFFKRTTDEIEAQNNDLCFIVE